MLIPCEGYVGKKHVVGVTILPAALTWIVDLGISRRKVDDHVPWQRFNIVNSFFQHNTTNTMPEPLALDLASKRTRTRNDYVYLEDYRSRW